MLIIGIRHWSVLKYYNLRRTDYVERLLKLKEKVASIPNLDFTIQGQKPLLFKRIERLDLNFPNVPPIYKRSNAFSALLRHSL
jgi:hypothetical protein